MSKYCNYTAAQWLSGAENELIELDQVKDCWPWESLTQDDWIYINKQLKAARFTKTIGQNVAVLIICPIGVVGSLLCAVTVWRKAIKERFYRWAFAIALLDFLYNLLSTSQYLSGFAYFPNYKTYSYLISQIVSTLPSIWASASIASDLCTLCLNAERLLMLKKKTAASEYQIRNLMTVIEITVISIWAGARFIVYIAQYSVVAIGTDNLGNAKYDWQVNKQVTSSQWWNNLLLTTNTIAPFILLPSMIVCSTWIGVIVAKRRKTQLFDQASTHQQRNVQKQTAAAVRLCFCLSSLFVCNQLGFIFNAVGNWTSNRATTSTLSSSYGDVYGAALASCFLYYSGPVKAIMECLSKSLNFFIYFLFTPSFREQFRKVGRTQSVVPSSN